MYELHELSKLSKYHDFFVNYTGMLNRHKRLIPIDVTELVENTREVLDNLEASDVPNVRGYAVTFGALIRAIETNNEVSEEDLMQQKVNQRISFTFRLLRLLNKTHELAVKDTEQQEAREKINWRSI